FMYNLKTKQSTQITDGMSAVNQPTFSRDGKYLFFSASTNTGLTNSGLHMTAYERNVNYNVYAFILSKDTPSIFKNESDEEEVAEDKKESNKKDDKSNNKDKKEKDNKSEEKSKEKKLDKPDTKVDLDDINRRIVALPLSSGRYGLNGAVESMLTYMRGSTIGIYDLKRLEDKTLVENATGSDISADGKKMIYRSNRYFFIGDPGKKPAPGDGKIEIKNVKQLVDPEAEWKQIF